MPSEIQRPTTVSLPFVDEDAGANTEPVRVVRFQESGLKWSQRSRLRERIDPHRIERGEITSQSADQRSAATEVARTRQSVLCQQVEKLSGGGFHDRRIPSWSVIAQRGARFARRKCLTSAKTWQDEAGSVRVG